MNLRRCWLNGVNTFAQMTSCSPRKHTNPSFYPKCCEMPIIVIVSPCLSIVIIFHISYSCKQQLLKAKSNNYSFSHQANRTNLHSLDCLLYKTLVILSIHRQSIRYFSIRFIGIFIEICSVHLNIKKKNNRPIGNYQYHACHPFIQLHSKALIIFVIDWNANNGITTVIYKLHANILSSPSIDEDNIT